MKKYSIPDESYLVGDNSGKAIRVKAGSFQGVGLVLFGPYQFPDWKHVSVGADEKCKISISANGKKYKKVNFVNGPWYVVELESGRVLEFRDYEIDFI